MGVIMITMVTRNWIECDADHVDPFSLLVLVLQEADFLFSHSKSESCVAPWAYGNFYDLAEKQVVYM